MNKELTKNGAVDGHSETSKINDTDSSEPINVLRLYLKEITKKPLLTAEQEVLYAKQIEKGDAVKRYLNSSRREKTDLSQLQLQRLESLINQAEHARSQMMESNLRLVVSFATKYQDRGVLLMDLIQEGNIGLSKAVEKYDWRRGFRFSTYASWWIRQAVTRTIADQSRLIRLPVHVNEILTRLNNEESAFSAQNGYLPTVEELALSLRMDPNFIRHIKFISKRPLSLETQIDTDEDLNIGSYIADESEDIDPQKQAEGKDGERLIEQIFNQYLTPHERRVLVLRKGLDGGREHTLEEIGKMFGVSRERIRQIETQALKKLRRRDVILRLEGGLIC